MLGACVVLGLVANVVNAAGPVVSTPNGELRGTRTAFGDDDYVDSFLNIPYAKPPTGNGRFRPSQPPDSWLGVRDASRHGNQCPQPSLEGLQDLFPSSEDCLYLNVWTPKVQASDNGKPLPVMLYVHGGWWIGTGNRLDGTQLARHGVVVITINYRLSALGFLCTEDAASPGNYGLWDMIRALEWVKNSISAFHGDPSRVTIFGESAGSVSVGLLLVARAAKGLFHQVIMESGCSLTFYAMSHPLVDPKPRDQAVKVARALGCPTDDTDTMVHCLRTKDAMDIVNATETLRLDGVGETLIPFQPVAETTFGQYGVFTELPEDVLQDGLFSNVSTIRGFTADEGSLYTAFDLDPEDDGFTMEEFMRWEKNLVSQFFHSSSLHVDLDQLEREILETYIYKPNITDPIGLRSAYMHMYDDFGVRSPTLKELTLMTQHPVPPQYVFVFSFLSPNTRLPSWAGAGHGSDVAYVFGAPIDGILAKGYDVSNWTDEDRRASETVMTLWTNFAKYGDPTPDAMEGVKWLPWAPAAQHSYLDIDLPLRLRDGHELLTPGVNFWMNTVPQIVGDDKIVLVG